MKNEDIQELKDISELVPIIFDRVEQLIYELGLDENNIPKIQFDYILKSVYKSVLEPNKYLYYNSSKHSYIVSSVYYIYNNCYLLLCLRYKQLINIMSFSYLVNIYYQALSNIYINNSIDKSLNNFNISLTKKILEDSEQTAVNLLQDAKTPLPYITILNNRFGWTQSGVSRTAEDSNKQTAITDAKKLFEQFAIDDTATDQPLKITDNN